MAKQPTQPYFGPHCATGIVMSFAMTDNVFFLVSRVQRQPESMKMELRGGGEGDDICCGM